MKGKQESILLFSQAKKFRKLNFDSVIVIKIFSFKINAWLRRFSSDPNSALSSPRSLNFPSLIIQNIAILMKIVLLYNQTLEVAEKNKNSLDDVVCRLD